MALVIKNPPASGGNVRDIGSMIGPERSPGGGRGNPLQFSRLENPVDRGVWRATVHGVKSRTRLSDQTPPPPHHTGQLPSRFSCV